MSRLKLGRSLLGVLVVFATGVWVLGSAMLCEGSIRVRRSTGYTLDLLTARNPGTVWRDVSLRASDGARLDAYFVQPVSAGPDAHGTDCVVVLHGIGDSRGSGAAGFIPMFPGYSVLLPDIRGHGTSGGDLMTFGVQEKDDLIRWTRWLRNQQKCNRVYGLGESLGGSILIQAAAVEPTAFQAIVAECPFADLRSIAEYRVTLLVPGWTAGPLVTGSLLYARTRYGFDLLQASPLAAMAKLRTPLLLIHGLADTATPPEHSRELAAAEAAGTASAALWLVPGARHVSASATLPGEFRERVLGWFKQH